MTTTEANPVPLSYEDAQRGYHDNAKARRSAREALRTALRAKAEAQHQFRKARAVAFAKHRSAGKAQDESKILADADAAEWELKRDMADVDAKTSLERLAELEAERATIRHLGEWGRES
jgi:hypothetical protein